MAIPNSTLEVGEEPSELPPALKGEGRPNPRALTLPSPPVVSVGLFNPEPIPYSDGVKPLFLYIMPVPILDRCLDGSRRGEDICGIEDDGTGTGF